jgi:hypothetical protein
MNKPSNFRNPAAVVLLVLAVGALRNFNQPKSPFRDYDKACVNGVTQSQVLDPPEEIIENLSYFKLPQQVEGLRSEIAVQFPSESRLNRSGATYVRIFFRIQKVAFDLWKPTLKLSKSSTEPTSSNEFSRMESFAWRLMVECKQDWWTPNSAQQSYRNFSNHPGAWLFDFNVSEVDPDKIDVYISGLMDN